MSARGAGVPRLVDANSLDEVAAIASGCTLCRLCNSRTQVVFGQGNPDADLLFVGEGPGYHDDRTGDPLTGAAGELLDELLRGIGMHRDDVYVTNIVKCRPPRNRKPFPDEIEQCEGYLFREVAMVEPRVICPLGDVALRLLTGKPLTLAQVRGRTRATTIMGRPTTIFPLYHPAAALYAKPLLESLRGDFRHLPRLLRGELADPVPAGAIASSPAESLSGESPQPRVSSHDDAQSQLSFDVGPGPAGE